MFMINTLMFMIEHYEITGMIFTGILVLIVLNGSLLALKLKEMFFD